MNSSDVQNQDDKTRPVRWRASEYQHQEKDLEWYGKVVLVVLVLVAFGWWQGNFFFSVFVVIAGVMVMFIGQRTPRIVDFEISDTSISVGEDINISLGNIDWFAVQKNDNKLDEIVIKKSAWFDPIVKLPIDSDTVEKAIDILDGRLPQRDYEESLLDSLAEWMRF